VHDVYSLDAPIGRGEAGATANVGAVVAWLSHSTAAESAEPSLARKLLGRLPVGQQIEETGQFIRTFYLSQQHQMLRFEVLIDYLPFSPEAMQLMGRIEQAATAAAAQSVQAGSVEVVSTGPTPYILAIRDVVSRDQLLVKTLASAVIALIVFALIRDLPLTLFMLAATWLTYGAAIAISQGFFVWVMGYDGLDWKVRLIVFVIIVAVGQDYNIFLVSRLFQEPSDLPDAEAARRAIIRTGSVISNCGLIMAATLGSLWAGQLGLLRQVGFALALGILLDTFFVRPLLLPSFFLATKRRRRRVLAGVAVPSQNEQCR
jgi:RND superfamily putative drug exporter